MSKSIIEADVGKPGSGKPNIIEGGVGGLIGPGPKGSGHRDRATVIRRKGGTGV